MLFHDVVFGIGNENIIFLMNLKSLEIKDHTFLIMMPTSLEHLLLNYLSKLLMNHLKELLFIREPYLQKRRKKVY
ncbi:hypothetical protein BW716_17445 [[Flexibacter] sp. ATCC 35208]|nr:hypothetical protein BW716_17445 [[Flexibacter] sp. ATCC 35208]